MALPLLVLILPLGFVLLAGTGAGYAACVLAGLLLWAMAGLLMPVRAGHLHLPWSDVVGLLLVWGGLFGWLVWINRSFSQIYAHDVLLVPTMARALLEAPASITAMAPFTVLPPGAPALLSLPAWWLSSAPLGGVTLLLVWAGLTQAAQAALPVLWALVLRRWFLLPLDRMSIALVLALVMLLLDRTVVLGGGVSQVRYLSLGLVLPLALLYLPLPGQVAGWRGGAWVVLLLGGVTCYAPSLLYLWLAWLAGWLVWQALLRRRRCARLWRQALWLAVLLLLMVRWFPGEMQAAIGTWSLDDRLRQSPGLWSLLSDPAEAFWFAHGEGASRCLWLGLSAGLAGVLLLTRRWWHRLPGLRSAQALPSGSSLTGRRLGVMAVTTLAMAVAICLLLLAVAGHGQSGLTADQGRWLVWPLGMVMLALPPLGLLLLMRWRGRLFTESLVLITILLLLGGAGTHADDIERRRLMSGVQGRSLHDVRQLAGLLAAAGPGRCVVVADSRPVVVGMRTFIQVHPLADVIEAVSPCQLAGGGLLSPPLPDGRVAGGLPGADTLAHWLDQGTVLVLGNAALGAQVQARIPAGHSLDRLGDVGPDWLALTLWRMR